jgi:hypothetical protein
MGQWRFEEEERNMGEKKMSTLNGIRVIRVIRGFFLSFSQILTPPPKVVCSLEPFPAAKRLFQGS